MNTQTTIEDKATQVLGIYSTPSFKFEDAEGRAAFFETYAGEILKGVIAKGTSRVQGRLIIEFPNGGWANVGSTIYFAD